jgi:tetratricopeptide (TPR) repeat protein
MARKPTIVRHGCAVFAIISISLAAVVAPAQNAVRVAGQAKSIENPYEPRGEFQPTTATEPPSRSGPRSQQNPFTATPSAMPALTPLRPGSLSRWQRSSMILKQPSSVANAFSLAPPLSLAASPPADPVGRAGVAPHRLPEIDNAQPMRDGGSTAVDAMTSTEAASPPDPVRFAAKNLTQPAWMLPDDDQLRTTTTADEIAAKGQLFVDPFELKNDSTGGAAPIIHTNATASLEPAAFQEHEGPRLLEGSPASRVGPATPSMLPVIVSDYVDTPDGWYAQAERLAHSAETLDDLSAVYGICQQGLQSGPAPESSQALRRLAAWAHNRRGELLIDADRPREALGEFQLAIGLDSNCALAIHNRGVTLAQQNKPDDALRDFNRVLELNPGLAMAYCNRAELLASLGRMDQAVRDYDRALEQLGDEPELYRARAYAWQRLGKFDLALDDLNKSIRLSPENANAFAQRGNLAAERGDFGQAVRDLERAIRLEPKLAEAYRSLAWLLATCPDEQFRDAGEALTLAEQGAALSETPDCLMLDALAAAQAGTGQFDEAVRTIRQAISAAPPDFAGPLHARLALYQRQQPFLNPSAGGVRAATHEESIVPPQAATGRK